MVADEFVGIHAEAHGASRTAPFEAGISENLGESHAFSDGGDALRAGNDDGLNALTDLAAFDVAGDFLEVTQTAVRAASEEGHIDLGALDGSAGLEVHVDEGFFGGGAVFFWNLAGEGNFLVDENRLPWIDAPGDGGGNVGGVVGYDIIVFRIGIRSGGFPAGDGGIPVGALRSEGAAFEVFESGVVGIHIAHARAALDGHIANGHALFLGEGIESGAREFIGVAEAAVDSEFSDDVENDILRVNAGGEFSIHFDAADLGLVERHGLGREDIADLAGANAKGDCAECTVGGSVGVTAGNRGAGLGDALLGTDDVDDALLAGGEIKKGDAIFRAVLAERLDHGVGEIVAERLDAFVGRNDVVHGGEGAVRV